MNIETPLMNIRRTTGMSSTYESAIYEAFVTMRGSGSALQSDISNRFVNLNGGTAWAHSGNKLIGGDNTSTHASGTAAWPAFNAGSDILIVAVGTLCTNYASGVIDGCRFGLGSGAAQHIVATMTQDGAPDPRFRDATNDAIIPTTTLATNPSDGDVVMIAAALDQGTDAHAYNYNITTGALINEVSLGNGGTVSVVDAPQPVAGDWDLTGWAEFYGGLVFEFTSGSLPATWKTDCLAIANKIKAAKA